MNVLLAAIFAVAAAAAQVPAARVADDARVVDRVAEVSKGDLPQDLLRRIVNEDLDLLRGKRADGTYAYAAYDRLEAARSAQSFSIDASDDKLSKVESKGAFVYRAIIDVPGRRLIVARNRPVYVDRIEIEYMPQGSSTVKNQVVKVDSWLEPGSLKPVDIEEIGRQTTVRVVGRSDKKKGYGNLTITLLQAKVIDLPDSPYADAVESVKAVLRGIDRSDISSIRSMAQRIASNLAPPTAPPSAATMNVVATPEPQRVEEVQPAAASVAAPASEIEGELQTIEDLLTGTDAEKRQGMDRLHQLIRRMRSR